LRQIKLPNPRTRLGHVVHQLLVREDRREFHFIQQKEYRNLYQF
jgi:hypothetical protein